MKTLFSLLVCFAVLSLLALALCNPPSLRSIRLALNRGGGITALNAITSGSNPSGKASRLADAAHAYRYLLVKTGSDINHMAVSGASDLPLGPCFDQPSEAEHSGGVNFLGAVQGTVLMVASAAIAAGVDLFTAANGEVQAEPTVAGTYYKVGRSVDASTGAHEELEVEPCAPVKLIVLAALASTDGTAGAASADLPGLAAEAEKIGDDLRRIAAAFASASMVKILAA